MEIAKGSVKFRFFKEKKITSNRRKEQGKETQEMKCGNLIRNVLKEIF